MTGISERETLSGIHVFGIDFIADPLKRELSWQDEEATGMLGGKTGKAWRQEMLRDWTIASGLGIYAEEFVRDWHVAKQPLQISKGIMVRGWDLGVTHLLPACVWGQADSLGRLGVCHELVTYRGRGPVKTVSIPQFVDNVIFVSNQLYPNMQWIDYVDPSAWTKSLVGTESKSCIDVMQAKGLNARPGPVTFQDRKNAMIGGLSMAVQGSPNMVIDPGCTMVIEGLGGAYKYEQIGETGRYKPVAEQNAWAHVISALEYMVGGLYTPPRRKSSRDENNYRRRAKKRDKVTGY